ncbi:hypothetical protein [Aestuariivita sp.]|jgi:hypothetical protein|uniref:hypothetical protein n=1 Tax=Aestuariivita sp. TaxID=1872407 RepID=UPI00216DB5F3|nr:hypothetical protein [Aestuariivita sp.]MCE8008236.1 hypothetical protein [Aestuariivita sp.]
MGLAEELGDKLAIDVLKVIDKLGDDQLVMEVAKVLAASSTPTEEAFLTSVRVRQAEARARGFLRDYVKKELAKRPQTPKD